MELKSENNFEVLSPAGDMERLKAAVAGGADAVYLGLKDYNARSKAGNFSENELGLALLYCHERNVRVYVTMNTLLKGPELKGAFATAEKIIKMGVDGIIAQDLALVTMIKKSYPSFPMHASTQAGVHNEYGAKAAEKLGFDRIVLSRETLPADMEKIRDSTREEQEFFIHGAHCISFSGNCYYSSLVSGYSGNRGKCLQLCRKQYTLKGEGKIKKGYMLSARDISLIKDTEKLKKLGIISGKIEGRLRSPEYTYVSAKAAKKAMSGKLSEKDQSDLKVTFNRGDYSKAYTECTKPDIVYPYVQSNIGLEIGECVWSGSRLITRLKPGVTLSDGDGVKLLQNGREVAGGEVIKGKINIQKRFQGKAALALTKSSKLMGEVSNRVKACDNTAANILCSRKEAWNGNYASKLLCNEFKIRENSVTILVNEKCSLDLCRHADYIIYAPLSYGDELAEYVKKLKAYGKPVLLSAPLNLKGRDTDILESVMKMDIFDGYVINNIYGLEMFKEYPCILGQGMNILNDYFKESKIVSCEAYDNPSNSLMEVFGRMTLMNLNHCPRRSLGFKCESCTEPALTLTDETGSEMILRRAMVSNCYYELLNGKVFNILSKIDYNINNRLLFDVRDVPCGMAEKALKMKTEFPFNEKTDTTGRFKKGVK